MRMVRHDACNMTAAAALLDKYSEEFSESHQIEMIEVLRLYTQHHHQLRKIKTASHISESPIAKTARETEYHVSLTEVSYRVLELLLRRSLVFVPVLAIIMQHIRVNRMIIYTRIDTQR